MLSASLRAFDATVRAGSIRQAADALGVAPSSVSRHIAQLERELGVAVFERRGNGVTLTFAGKLAADYARSVLVEYDTLRTELAELGGVQRRLVRVALVESVATAGPVAAAAKLLQTYPSVSFQMREMPAPQVIEAVRADDCDIGLAFGAEPDPEIAALGLAIEPVVALIPREHPLGACESIDLQQLAHIPLALPDVGFGVRRMLDRGAAAAGLTLAPTLTSNDFGMLREFVRCGAGVALLPLRACPAEAGLTIAPLSDPGFAQSSVSVLVLRRRRLPRVVRAFADLLLAELAKDGAQARA